MKTFFAFVSYKLRGGSQKKLRKKVWTKIFKVGRSDIDVHTYESMRNPEYSDGRDRFPVVWKGFLYILSQPSRKP